MEIRINYCSNDKPKLKLTEYKRDVDKQYKKAMSQTTATTNIKQCREE
jgi:hypothetical protein